MNDDNLESKALCKVQKFHECSFCSNRRHAAGKLLVPYICIFSSFQTGIELVGGPNNRSGTVVLTAGGKTGIICGGGYWYPEWDRREARVVCNMLGFT